MNRIHDDRADTKQPRLPLPIIERHAVSHACDRLDGMQVIGVIKAPTERPGERPADGCLAAAGHAGDENDGAAAESGQDQDSGRYTKARRP